MVNKIFCDRCKLETETSEAVRLGPNTHDLCESCYTELMEFIFKYKKGGRK